VKMLLVAAGAAGAHNNNAAAEASRVHETHCHPRSSAEARIFIATISS
jgi:hypothetical protein